MREMWGGGGIYHQWAEFLDRWGGGQPTDPVQLPPLSPEDLTGDAWERLTNRLTDALSQRLGAWADALTRGIGEARDEFGVGRALSHARSGLVRIRALAGHPSLPTELGARLLALVDGQVRSAQESLERQVDQMRRAGADRDAVEARLRTIRDNPLTVALAQKPDGTPGVGSTDWYAGLSGPARRRVIVGPPPPLPSPPES